MWFLAVAAGGQPLGVTRGGPGLADLVEVREERQDGLSFPGKIDQRLRAAQRRPGLFEEALDQGDGLLDLDLAVRLLLRPARPGHKQQVGVGADGLLVAGRCLHAFDRRALHALGQRDLDGLDGGGPGRTLPCRCDAAFQGQDPRALGARHPGLHALAVVPARNGGCPALGAQFGDVRVGTAAEAVGHARKHAVPPRRGRRHYQGRGARAGQGFGRRRVGGVARLAEGRAGHAQEAGCPAAGDRLRGGCGVRPDQTDAERRAEGGGKLADGFQRLKGRAGQGAVGFRMGEEKNGIHGSDGCWFSGEVFGQTNWKGHGLS